VKGSTTWYHVCDTGKIQDVLKPKKIKKELDQPPVEMSSIKPEEVAIALAPAVKTMEPKPIPTKDDL